MKATITKDRFSKFESLLILIPIQLRGTFTIPNVTSLICILLILFSCSKPSDDGPKPIEPTKHKLLIAGYVPYYTFQRFDLSSLNAIHRLYYFSLWPDVEGNFQYFERDIENLNTLKNNLNSEHCELFLVIGGMYESETIHTMAASKTKRTAYIQQLVDFCQLHEISGIDLDWEGYPYPIDQNDFRALIEEMSLAFRGNGLLFTVALEVRHADLANQIKHQVDQINLMSYGILDENGNQATLMQMANWLDTYKKSGFPSDQLIVGVPFFSWRPYVEGDDSPRALTYRSIVEKSNPSAHTNKYNGYSYNGRALMKSKVDFLKKRAYYGIMAWELTQDMPISSPYSLLDAIHTAN